MYEEVNKNSLKCDRLGGIIFDEMSIQQNIRIEKNGSVSELNGLNELGTDEDMYVSSAERFKK
ncbi:hypothetical protein DPMN_192527 [Dreissena polymorpha]|uniref:Uncharacterized protein n=1 Tax=Dreissena polymorpha TaxID=45954 RepID=A0A9D3Y6G6_DREPO|nr:hypothetical protein DPMN_192527 [Dreissena polymorpha]